MSDDEIYRALLDAVADLERVRDGPPDEQVVRAFADGADGVARRFLDDPTASADGFLVEDLRRDGDWIVATGTLWMLISSGRGPDSQRWPATVRISSRRGGEVSIGAPPRTLRVPPAAELGG